MTLLIMTYLDDGGLPDSDTKLAFLTGLPIEDIEALRPYFEFLGRCEGGRLYLDFAEDVIMERVEFAEKKANAGAKRWKSSDSSAKSETPKQSTAKHSKAQLSTVKPYKQTDKQTFSDSANALSGAAALAEPLSDAGEPPPEAGRRPPDPLFVEFCAQFETVHAGEPYAYKPADFVKLAELRKRYAKAKPAPWDVTPERFRVAAEHYFASDLATHTLADLCERFSTFFRNAVDRFNKPMGGLNGQTAISKNGNDANRGRAARSTEADGIKDCELL